MKALFLGTGTSVGIPQIGCNCPVCMSPDTRNKRLRPSLLLEIKDKRILIDIGQDFRQQMLTHAINRLDAILLTHSHADHILGIDDLRSLNARMRRSVPIYASRITINAVERTFFYCFEKSDNDYASRPDFNLIEFGPGHFCIDGIDVIPIAVEHGSMQVSGFRFGDFAYITDAKHIPPESLAKLKGLDTLVINALRFTPHPTHFSVEEACSAIAQIAPKRAFLTHIGHGIDHGADSTHLPDGVEFAFDGLRLEIEEQTH